MPVLATVQHRQLFDQVIQIFGIVPDIDLDIMFPHQALTTQPACLLLDLDDVSLACFYHKYRSAMSKLGYAPGICRTRSRKR